MARGTKMGRNSGPNEDHQISYEADKLEVKPGKVKDSKISEGIQREAVGKKGEITY